MKRMRKVLAILLSFTMIFAYTTSIFAVDSGAGTATIDVVGSDGQVKSTQSSLSNAIATAQDGDVLKLNGNITCNAGVTVNKELTIEGGAWTINRGSGNDDTMIEIGAMGNLTLQNVAIDGQKGIASCGNTTRMISVLGGSLSIGEKAVLRNQENVTIFLTKPTSHVVLDGGTISGTAQRENDYGGTAVELRDGTFTMNSGKICDTEHPIDSGLTGTAVYVDGSGTFEMNGGTIENNRGKAGAVAVRGAAGGTGNTAAFHMKGGTISGNFNDYYWGAGVCVWGENEDYFSKFIMDGGTISGNEATWAGGGVCIAKNPDKNGNASFVMNGGSISDNKCGDLGGGLFVRKDVEVSINGGTIAGNIADVDGDGIASVLVDNLKMAGTPDIRDTVWLENSIPVISVTSDAFAPVNPIKLESSNPEVDDPLADYAEAAAEADLSDFDLVNLGYTLVQNADKSKLLIAKGGKVTFDSNGGSAVSAIAKLTEGTEVTKPADPTKSGYRFAGWYKDAELTDDWNFAEDKMPADDLILYAKWTKVIPAPLPTVNYEATFDSDGGSTVSTIKGLSYGSLLKQPADPTKDGFDFAGWYSDEALTKPWDFSKDTIKGNTVLYAKWVESDEARIARIKAGVADTRIKLRTSYYKKYIKLNWTKSKGYKVNYYEVYKSKKRNSGYGNKPYFKGALRRFYINTKELKKGTRYYYKVRGVRIIDGEKIYTKWSNKAFRVAKYNI